MNPNLILVCISYFHMIKIICATNLQIAGSWSWAFIPGLQVLDLLITRHRSWVLGRRLWTLDFRSWISGWVLVDPFRNYYKFWKNVPGVTGVTKCCSYYEAWKNITKYYDRYHKMSQGVVAKCDRYYKVWQLLQSETKQGPLFTIR